MPPHGPATHAQAGCDGNFGGAFQRIVRSGRRDGDGPPSGAVAGVRRAHGDGHLTGRDRRDRRIRNDRPGDVRQRRCAQGGADRCAGGRRGPVRDVAPATGPDRDDRAAVRAVDDRGCGGPGRVILAIVMGAAGGVISGMLGVGGGILFVPALTLVLSLSQVKAEATSLLAIIPVALVGAARQNRYGNVRLRDGAVLGALSAVGVLGGVALANALPQRALRLLFAAMMLFVATQFLRRFARTRASKAADRPRPNADGSDASDLSD